jgi:hypothetical protein
LKEEQRTWKEEGLIFLQTATTSDRNVIAGMQYYYDSKLSAQSRNEDIDDWDMTDVGNADTRMEDDAVEDGAIQVMVNLKNHC